jgi:uncharacterized membrane protein
MVQIILYIMAILGTIFILCLILFFILVLSDNTTDLTGQSDRQLNNCDYNNN